MVKPFACLLACLLLAACATRRADPPPDAAPASRAGSVGFQDISGLVNVPVRVSLAPNETYLEPLEAVGSPMPGYPPVLLGARLAPQTVCVSVAIDAQGGILSSGGVIAPPACPAPAEAAFLDAVRTTLAGWTFEPARRCVFPSVAAKELANANCSGGREIPIPVTLTYRFVFEQHDGKGVVRMGR